MDHENWAYGHDDEIADATAEAHAATDEPPGVQSAQPVVEGAEDGEAEDDEYSEPDDHADAFEGVGAEATEPEKLRWMMAAVRNEQTDDKFMVGIRIGDEDDDRGVLVPPSVAINLAREMVTLANACEAGNAIIDIFHGAGMEPDTTVNDFASEADALTDEDRAKLEMIARFVNNAHPLQD